MKAGTVTQGIRGGGRRPMAVSSHFEQPTGDRCFDAAALAYDLAQTVGPLVCHLLSSLGFTFALSLTGSVRQAAARPGELVPFSKDNSQLRCVPEELRTT